jgi:hypothetical protein
LGAGTTAQSAIFCVAGLEQFNAIELNQDFRVSRIMINPNASSGWVSTLICIGWLTSSSICIAQVPGQAASVQPDARQTRHRGGIWKAAVPAETMRGEFDSFDPLGVAAGAKIKADCSLNWISPDDGRRYCFASGTSLVYFLDQPQTNIERARKGWQQLAAATN